MKPYELTIKKASELLASGELSSRKLTESCLNRIEQINHELNACIIVDWNKAIAAADAADDRLAKGERAPLLGIPYLLKDNILAKDWCTTAASKMLENYIAPYNATVVDRLQAAGAVLLGKTNLDEFAHGASTETSYYGPTLNPWDKSRVPGGSSGGSAAAVAAGMALFALGTDTGGSIRHPAAFCGVVGLKPSYGLCSRFGLIAMTSSTDVPGPITKTAEDAALVLEVMVGHDERDLTTAKNEVENYSDNIQDFSLSGLRIGVVPEFMSDNVDEGVKRHIHHAIEWAKKQGAQIVDVSLPHALYGVSVYYIVTPSEVSSNLARYDGIRFGLHASGENLEEEYLNSRSEGFGPEVKRRIMLGTYALSAGYYDAYYLKAQKVRTKIIEDFNVAFKTVDVLLCPTVPNTAFKIGGQISDPLKMYLEDIFLTPASLAGLPAISIPAGLSEGLPVGLQLMADRWQEAKLLAAAQAFQSGLNSELLCPEIN